ncbi:MAG: aminotransferase class V-fold PLP-dependent enzyme [Archangiaceae bacterium]|nr:aminotransferase class V-fold PLP-dependent enzyme [Archangiaceae bacterium]
MNSKVRADFPLLERTLDGRPVVYLDSAATSLKPRAVVDAEVEYLTRFTANVHRGKHALSEEASALFEAARRRVARFLNAAPDEVVFVANTTAGLNLVAAGLDLGRDDRVVCAVGDHHSNLVPWLHRAQVTVLDADPREPLDPARVAAVLDQVRPRVLALGHASNVTGVVHPVAKLAALARERGIITVLDAAQSAPHLPLDVQQLGCDFVCFSAHKLLGPTGVGVLWGRLERLEALTPQVVGGGTVEQVSERGFTFKRLPYRLEGGTPNISGVLGFAAALDWLERLGFDAVVAHERALADQLQRELEGLRGVEVLMATGPERLALASIAPRTATVSPDHLATILSDGSQVMVRSGFHCARPALARLGAAHGALRVSAYLYNTAEELTRFSAALRGLLEKLTA